MKKLLIIVILFTFMISGFSTSASFQKFENKVISSNHLTKISQINEYDLVIISPNEFTQQLQRLLEHKNNHGIQTIIKTTEDIYTQYQGRDQAEEIKYFIKDAIETLNIKFVLLVGGLKSLIYSTARDTNNIGSIGWHVPVRYINMIEPRGFNIFDPGFISDLYYADIYDNEGNFSSWDPNNNGIFGDWNNRKDTPDSFEVIDFYPDVAIGRLACRNKKELSSVIDKIIYYETESFGELWHNRFVVAGSDPLNDIVTKYPDGEILCEHIISNYMSDFDAIRLYGSHRDTDPEMIPTTENIIRELENGCSFFLLDSHGSPATTKTYWPDNFDTNDMIDCLSVYDLPKLKNNQKYPIIVLGGCWCCQFNVSLLNNIITDYHYFGRITPECIGWSLVRKSNAGGIATLGFTSLGYITYFGENGDIDHDGIEEPDYVENGWGFIESCFFESLKENGEYLGNVWKNAEIKYLSIFPIVEKNDWREAKDLCAWTLLGDPSLKIGGYSYE